MFFLLDGADQILATADINKNNTKQEIVEIDISIKHSCNPGVG